MVLNPEVQAKAQAEIDRVVGKDRLPDFDDRPSLPYLDAVLRETLRWYPVAPFGLFTAQFLLQHLTIPSGIPHATTTSDIYKDCFIPKGLYHAELTIPADDAVCKALLYLQMHGKSPLSLYCMPPMTKIQGDDAR